MKDTKYTVKDAIEQLQKMVDVLNTYPKRAEFNAFIASKNADGAPNMCADFKLDDIIIICDNDKIHSKGDVTMVINNIVVEPVKSCK